MNKEIKTEFPCTACGQCCRLVYLSEETAHLNRGDGVCRHFDEKQNLCSIYENRPLVCNIKQYYLTYLTEEMTWNHFITINWAVCEKLSMNL